MDFKDHDHYPPYNQRLHSVNQDERLSGPVKDFIHDNKTVGYETWFKVRAIKRAVYG